MKIFKRYLMSIAVFGFFVVPIYNKCYSSDIEISIYKQMATFDKNLVLSPYNTSNAFQIAFIGARAQTAEQIASVFGFKANRPIPKIASNNERILVYSAANIWPDHNFKTDSSFISIIKSKFDVKVNVMDFDSAEKTCKIINHWISQETKDHIKSVISPTDITKKDRMILTSAIYFKGNWESPFQVGSTENLPFNIDEKKNVVVPTMYQEGLFSYGQFGNLEVLQLLYADPNFAMFIFLPNKKTNLTNIVKSLSLDSIYSWTNNLEEVDIEVYLPRFKFYHTTDIAAGLKRLGINNAFDKSKADFSGICNTPIGIYISKAFQTTMINVDENGTEASAIDELIGSLMGGDGSPPPPVFRADHPFLFILMDKSTKTILFIGQVVNPNDE
jgi:serpin B